MENKEIKYAIEYEHLKELYNKDDRERFIFNEVVESANKNNLELSDKDFDRCIKLYKQGKDLNWIMFKMNRYNMEFIDVLISYLAWC